MTTKKEDIAMKLLGSMAVIAMLSGCGMAEVDRNLGLPSVRQDADLMAFVDEFLGDADERGVKVSLYQLRIVEWNDDLTPFIDNLAKPEHGFVVGVCDVMKVELTSQLNKRSTKTWKEIHIHSSARGSYIHVQKKLMYHELGHCLLGKDHVDDPTSIMYPFLNPYDVDTWESKVDELFQPL
jgi:hypothetical protein